MQEGIVNQVLSRDALPDGVTVEQLSKLVIQLAAMVRSVREQNNRLTARVARLEASRYQQRKKLKEARERAVIARTKQDFITQ